MKKIANKHILDAIEQAGGSDKVAEKMGIGRGCFSLWIRGHQPIPLKRAQELEKMTKKKFTVEMLMAHHKKTFKKKK